jgi:hypothetical protein
MAHYHHVRSVVDVAAMTDTVRWIQDKVWVDRIEATIEAHTLPIAQVRENCTIRGRRCVRHGSAATSRR